MESTDEPYRIWWDQSSGVVHHQWLEGAVCGIDEARSSVAEFSALGHGKVPLLVDLRQLHAIDRPAREFFKNHGHTASAVALVTGSASTRVMANFWLGLNRLDIPVKMFTADSDALAWLQAQR